jgi:hypothetical protein
LIAKLIACRTKPRKEDKSHMKTLFRRATPSNMLKNNASIDASSAFPKCSSADRLDNKRRQTLLRLLHSSLCQRSQTPVFADRRIICFTRSNVVLPVTGLPGRSAEQARLHPLGFGVAAIALRAKAGGGERDRTDDLLLAKQALSQLSYTPASANHQLMPSKSVGGPGRI